MQRCSVTFFPDLRSLGDASSPQPAPDLPTYPTSTYPRASAFALRRETTNSYLIHTSTSGIVCVILKVSSLFPMSAVDSQLLYAFGRLVLRISGSGMLRVIVGHRFWYGKY